MPTRATYKGEVIERYADVTDPDGKTSRILVERVPVGHLTGIPARDLSEDEWQSLNADQRKMVRDSGLYDVKTDAQMSGKGE